MHMISEPENEIAQKICCNSFSKQQYFVMKINFESFADIFGLPIFIYLIIRGFLSASRTNIPVSKSFECPLLWGFWSDDS